MTYQEALAHFGTQVKMAAALGITQSTVSLWKGSVPAAYQYQMEIITDGALQADIELRRPKNGADTAKAAA
jgi:DNA-binding transcriptional regulator YdaS (Cro superfamily)